LSWTSVDDVARAIRAHDYVGDADLHTVLLIARTLEQPVLLEGEPGVGKTEVAKAVAGALGSRLIRLQCFEGIDAQSALYDWDFARQLLELRTAEDRAAVDLYDRRFLVARPLLEAIEADEPVVLLLDEIDRADDQFEAFLLELLSDFQVTIPELGTLTAARRPFVILTSNRTRELHDALKRRCLYHWIDYPDSEREFEIVRTRIPEIPEQLAERVCHAVAKLRGQDLYKAPGVGETLAWARALTAIDGLSLDAALSAALKVREDIEAVRESGVLERA
jgi:MoxR-like ATPase